MALNPAQFPVYAGVLLCCWLGRRAALRWGGSMVVALAFTALAIPALLYDLYYLRLWDEPMWLYQMRSWRGSELLAAPAGLLAGWVQGRLKGRWRVSLPSVMVLMLLTMTVPYVKQLTPPTELHDKWRDGVCLQSSPSTCGPASAATLLAALGIPVTEADLARDSYSTYSGTENWYLKRAIERRGVACHYDWVAPPVARLPCPSIAGLRMGEESGHFVAILSADKDGYTIADPRRGRSRITHATLAKGRVPFSGFFLVFPDSVEEAD